MHACQRMHWEWQWTRLKKAAVSRKKAGKESAKFHSSGNGVNRDLSGLSLFRIAFSLNSLCMLVETALVQDQLCRAAIAVGNKSDLGINDLEKIIVIAFRKNL